MWIPKLYLGVLIAVGSLVSDPQAYGDGADKLTLSVRTLLCDHLVRVKRISAKEPGANDLGRTTFEILDVAKSKSGLLKPGAKIDWPQFLPEDDGTSYVMIFERGKWKAPGETDDVFWDYLKNLPPPTTDKHVAIKRLRWFLGYVGDSNATISGDAITEVFDRDLSDIRALHDLLPEAKLRELVFDSSTSANHRGEYAILLAMCGNQKDRQPLRLLAFDHPEDYRRDASGIMVAYLILSDLVGLDEIGERLFKAKTFETPEGKTTPMPFSETYAAWTAVGVMRDQFPDVIPPDRANQALHLLLNRPELADLAISDLARAKDWTLQDRLMSMYDGEEFDIPSVKRAIVRYFMMCADQMPNDSEEAKSLIETAKRNLKLLEQKDPKTVKNVKRFYVGP